MAKYTSTGKINFPKTVLGLTGGAALAVIVGLVYGWAMDLIPFIIVELFVLVGVIILLVALVTGIIRIGVIRNKGVKILVALIVSLVAWYAQWVYTTQHDFWESLFKFDRVFDDILSWSDSHEITLSRALSSSGAGISGIALMILYGIELILFLLPTILVFTFQKEYFCEACGKFNENEEFYLSELDETKIPSSEQTGDFGFIAELQGTKDLTHLIGSVYHVEFSHCASCGQNGVINIRKGLVDYDAKRKKRTFNSKSSLAKNVIVSNGATKALCERKNLS